MSASIPETLSELSIHYNSFIEEGDADILESLYETSLGEQVFEAINGHVFDRVGSAAVYARTFGEDWLQEDNKLMVLLGCDGGIMLPYLQETLTGKHCKIIVIDLPELLPWIEDHIDYDHDLIRLLPADGNLSILRSEDFHTYLYRNSISTHRSMATLDQFHPAYARFWTEYEQLLNRFFYTNMMEIHGSTGFFNAQLINLSENKHSIHHLYHQFDGGVAVVLAGGPSLDDAMDWVKENRERITLFAVGRVSGRLLKEGIEPDFICAVDPNEISFDNSKHLLEHYKKSTFLYAYHVNPRLLSQWRGRSFYHGRRYPWIVKEPDADKQYSAPGPTVTNTMLSFITHMGFESVVFAGVDMCHKSDGQSHESGSIESQVGRFVGTYRATNLVTTNSGNLAPTTPDLFTAQQVLAVQVRSIKMHFPKMAFYNPSPDAAFIDGVEYVSWQNLVLPEWHNNALDRVDAVLEKLRFNMDNFLAATEKEITRMRTKLVRVVSQAEQGLKATAKLFDSPEATPRRTKQVLKARSAMEGQLKASMPILIDYAPTAFHDMLLTDLAEKQSNDDIQLSLTHYFNAIKGASSPLLSLVEHSLSLIHLRQDERKKTVLTSDLVNRWVRYGQPGRLYVWLDNHDRKIEDLSEIEGAFAYPVIRAYEAIFKVADSAIVKKFKQNVHDNTLDSVTKAMIQVTESNITKLDEVLAYCEEHAQEDYFYRDLGLYILGYFNKLREQIEPAYQLWSMVTHPKLQQLVLRDHLNLALLHNHYEQALTVLQKLCVLNRRFLTIYAGVLVAIGQSNMAIDILTAYLKDESEDIAARLQLARLLLDAQDMDRAKVVLEEAYRQSPTNPIVQRLFTQSGGQVSSALAAAL
jgi:tetratricopeptide (TPR) repeat protein